MAKRIRGTYMTNSGMTCLWNPAAFIDVMDYDTWEAELLEDEDIRRHIRAGAFVPINIQSDGVYEIEVRVGTAADPAVLSEREAKYEFVASEPYLFRSTGRLCVSGIECVEKKPADGVGVLAIPRGDYAVKVHLIGWDQEPGMKRKDGKPKKEALPDFVAVMNPKPKGKTKFRTKVETFPPPG
jgi:hypothetical protein